MSLTYDYLIEDEFFQDIPPPATNMLGSIQGVLALQLASQMMNAPSNGTGGYSQELLERFVPGFGSLHSLILNHVGIDITLAVSWIALSLAAFTSARWAARQTFPLMLNFCTSMVSIPSNDRLNKEILAWMSAQIVEKHGTRALAAVSSFYEWAVATELFSGENPLHRRRDLALTSVPNRHQPFTGSASRQQPVRRDVRVRVPSRLPRPMTDAEITALLDSMTNLRDLAMVLLMLDGGERPGEVLSLHLEDIAYGHRRVTVRKRDYHPRGARQKSRRERVVDLLEPRTLDAVNRYVLHERPQEAETPFVFLIGGRGKRLPSRCPTPHLFE